MFRKCSSPMSKVDCHKMMLMIRRTSRYPGRDFARKGNAMFSNLLLSSKSQGPRDKKQHCHLRLRRRPSVEKRFRRVHSFYLHQKNEYFLHEWLSSQDVFSSMLRSCCKNWPCEDNEADADLKVSSELKYSFLQADCHPTHCWKWM